MTTYAASLECNLARRKGGGGDFLGMKRERRGGGGSCEEQSRLAIFSHVCAAYPKSIVILGIFYQILSLKHNSMR